MNTSFFFKFRSIRIQEAFRFCTKTGIKNNITETEATEALQGVSLLFNKNGHGRFTESWRIFHNHPGEYSAISIEHFQGIAMAGITS